MPESARPENGIFGNMCLDHVDVTRLECSHKTAQWGHLGNYVMFPVGLFNIWSG